MTAGLALLPAGERSRAARDRLELLSALIAAPAFDALLRSEVIRVPRDHRVYGWGCQVAGCERSGSAAGLCQDHHALWRKAGTRRAEFIAGASPLPKSTGLGIGSCRICPERPAPAAGIGLCSRHLGRWKSHRVAVPGADLARWAAGQAPLPGYGGCRAAVCPYLAGSPMGLCPGHQNIYYFAGKPGGACLPKSWVRSFEDKGLPVPVTIGDETAFRRWCEGAEPVQHQDGTVNLKGLQPLARAELQWGMHAHGQLRAPSHWGLPPLQRLATLCRVRGAASLFDLVTDSPTRPGTPERYDSRVAMIISGMVESLWCVYYAPGDTREAGFIETDHFGRRFPGSRSHFDLTGVSQRWLRDMLWDHLAGMLRSASPPRSRSPFDHHRRAAIELSAFLEADAPGGGHDPSLLHEEHAQRFVADQRHRARHGLRSLGISRSDGTPSPVNEGTRRVVFNHVRSLAYRAMENGSADAIGLDRSFITALPAGGTDPKRGRSPFSDEVARALVSQENLLLLGEVYDPADRGLRDAWEAMVFTGRRCSEILNLRLDCTGRYHGLPMLWHDQTKVGNYDEAIRIPDALCDRLAERRAKTLARFEDSHGRQPAPAERERMALFPSGIRNPGYDRSISYSRFNATFRKWVGSLDLGPAVVAHQARHTLATNLLRAGASLAHIRKYLGQVSDKMAEHYAKVAHSDLEDVLNAVWVAGPGSDSPGMLLSGGQPPLTRESALALAIDLSRRSTPTDGGFCTFQPVVNGGACPWNLDCENCDKFVMSGADLLYWRRKQQQWRAIAERAPDDATADYLHQVFEPTARAIDGLEKALAAFGLLDQARALDLRRPQDYFHRVWSTAFRAVDLAHGEDDAVPVGPPGSAA